MKAKTEEFLYFLMWTCDRSMRPTFRNLTDSFEAWAYRNGLTQALANLERRGYLESRGGSVPQTPRLERARRLSDAGRLHALGGRDPVAAWNRTWNGLWHVVLFDLPAVEGTRRNQIRNALRARGFGWLQKSVWISPHPLPDQDRLLGGVSVEVESLVCMEARPSAGETDQEIVAGAWDFEEINRRYRGLLEVLRRCPACRAFSPPAPAALRRWAAQERCAWHEAVSRDPLLPACLLPPGYLGREAWDRRCDRLERAARVWHRLALPTGMGALTGLSGD